MPAIFLTHDDDARAHYYGDEALARLRALGEVRLNETGRPLTTAEVIEHAAGCQVIVSYRQTEGPAEIFAKLPDLVAFVRCAVDIRNIDVGAASAAGVLVTRASPGFIDSVAELAVGMMVDLARGITAATAAYQAGQPPAAVDGPPASRQHSRHHRLRQHRQAARRARPGARHAGAGERSPRPGAAAAAPDRPRHAAGAIRLRGLPGRRDRQRPRT